MTPIAVRQPGSGLDLDVVHGRSARDAGLAVGEDPVAVGDVLVERAAQRDVQHLVAAADRQRRDTAIDGGTCERELEAVPVRDDAVDLVAPLLAVLLGVEVAAAHQQQPVEPFEHGSGVGVVDRRRA